MLDPKIMFVRSHSTKPRLCRYFLVYWQYVVWITTQFQFQIDVKMNAKNRKIDRQCNHIIRIWSVVEICIASEGVSILILKGFVISNKLIIERKIAKFWNCFENLKFVICIVFSPIFVRKNRIAYFLLLAYCVCSQLVCRKVFGAEHHENAE